MQEKYGFVYIWRDKKHNRYYIGCHWGNENDGYICSSSNMKSAYKRRPFDFTRKIIKTNISDKKQLLEEEYKWLSLIKDEELGKKYYNLHNHHFDHWSSNEERAKTIQERLSSSIRAARERPEVKANYIEGIKRRNTRSSDPEVRAKRSESMKRAMAIKFPNRRVRDKFGSDEYRENMRAKSREMWRDPSHRERVGKKISESLMGRPSPVKGTFWWNNGSINKRSAESPGENWTRGKL